MNIWDVVKLVGPGLLSSNPAGMAIMGAVNLMLPDDKQLPVTATGVNAVNAINSLPPEDQVKIKTKQVDLQITTVKESHSTVRTMLEADAKSPHTTRPYVVKHSFHVIAFCSALTVILWAYAVGSANDKMVKTIMDGWPFVVGILAPFVVLLRTYFGVLKQEHKDRLDAAGGMPSALPKPFAGIVQKLLS